MNADAILHAWTQSDEDLASSPAALRLARRVPAAQEHLREILNDPLKRALAGIGEPPASDGSLAMDILIAQARIDGGEHLSEDQAAELEARAEGDIQWWIPAARIHAICSQDRQRRSRSALANQQLPYVFPGEIHPLMVDLLAAGDRVLPALHVDWVRKLTKWVSQLLVTDLEHLGLWFWPILDSLDQGRLARPLPRLISRRNWPPGGLGLAVAYCHSIGTPGALLLDQCGPTDRLIAALAWASTSGSTATP